MKAKKLTQADIGKALGIHQTAVSSRLGGKTSFTLKDLENLQPLGLQVHIGINEKSEVA